MKELFLGVIWTGLIALGYGVVRWLFRRGGPDLPEPGRRRRQIPPYVWENYIFPDTFNHDVRGTDRKDYS